MKLMDQFTDHKVTLVSESAIKDQNQPYPHAPKELVQTQIQPVKSMDVTVMIKKQKRMKLMVSTILEVKKLYKMVTIATTMEVQMT